MTNFYIIHNEYPYLTLNRNQPEEFIQYAQKRYHSYFIEKNEVIDY